MAKRCTRCNQWRDSSDFYKDKSKLDGLKSHCKRCHETYKRGYRATPAAKLLQERRAYVRKYHVVAVAEAALTDPEGQAALYRAWRKRNEARRKAHLRAWARKWHTQNKTESRRQRRENREVARTASQEQRAARAAAAINTLSPEEWQWLLERYEFCCAYCGREGDGLTPDHVVPLSRGGNNSLSNIVPACGPCNLSKGPRTPEEAGLTFAVQVNALRSLQQLSLI
jgi:5-methylcytosine-specific restriction endonuclease McrA